MSNEDEFGRLLHRLRRERDLTQEALGQACFCSRDTIKKLEAGQRRPSRQLAAQLADVLGLAGQERTTFLATARANQSPPEVLKPPPRDTPAPPTPRPTGTITFLFTDIEGSTQLWEQQRAAMQKAFPRQEALLRDVLTAHGGYVYKMIGDAFQVAFSNAQDALSAALEAQRRLAAEDWGELGSLLVRIALDSGIAEERADDYVGPLLNRLGRLLAATHGGQILLSAAAAELARTNLPPGVALTLLGSYHLKDLQQPETIYQASAPDLPAAFPPPRAAIPVNAAPRRTLPTATTLARSAA